MALKETFFLFLITNSGLISEKNAASISKDEDANCVIVDCNLDLAVEKCPKTCKKEPDMCKLADCNKPESLKTCSKTCSGSSGRAIDDTGPSVDCDLQNVKNIETMRKGGWKDNELERHRRYAWYCERDNTFWGYKYASPIGHVNATFKGSGKATLDFGNCYDKSGKTVVYLNNKSIAEAGILQMSEVTSFDYKKGDVLKIAEKHGNNKDQFI